jgi:uncharacterized protein
MQYVRLGADTTGTLKTMIAVAVDGAGLAVSAPDARVGAHIPHRLSGTLQIPQAPLTIAAGALLGALVTLASIAASALGVVFLAYMYPLRLTASPLVATDIAHAIRWRCLPAWGIF